ncbi:acyl-CoA-6-aminopenicillanic acid acyltransferase [Rhodococcus opacus M213]|uniref:Acyl-CoA-6-aminopenicillanic acid acyltransferase n=1 Tax=Rhodococcus opacus M213 TaxID=1129896 RepID=K8XE08_RHOOP|nr:C45 family peptidase [Rhodococcus opacus]EKT79071.1 acyl-CoA-6-aminopenicillanic acid acyltransferase [Rhodococcus opacus M213]
MYTFVGNAYERGKQHGRALADAIGDRVSRTLSPDMDAAERIRIAQPWLDATEELDADLVREMDGLAAGSGATLAEIVLLNSPEAFKALESVEKRGCTVVGVTTKDQTVIAQNWDANPQRAKGLAVHQHRDPQAPDVAVLALPGGLGFIGMNEYGLALVNNDLFGVQTARTAPSQAIRRALLKLTDTSSAVSAMLAIAHPTVRSYVLADSTGALAAVEVLPHETPVVSTAATTVVHANHAVAPSVRAVEDRDIQESVHPSSAHRARRAAELMEQSDEESDQQGRLRRILHDHKGFPLSICSHSAPPEESCTVASVIFDCTKRQAAFHLGHACEPHAYEVVDFGATAPSAAHGRGAHGGLA